MKTPPENAFMVVLTSEMEAMSATHLELFMRSYLNTLLDWIDGMAWCRPVLRIVNYKIRIEVNRCVDMLKDVRPEEDLEEDLPWHNQFKRTLKWVEFVVQNCLFGRKICARMLCVAWCVEQLEFICMFGDSIRGYKKGVEAMSHIIYLASLPEAFGEFPPCVERIIQSKMDT